MFFGIYHDFSVFGVSKQWAQSIWGFDTTKQSGPLRFISQVSLCIYTEPEIKNMRGKSGSLWTVNAMRLLFKNYVHPKKQLTMGCEEKRPLRSGRENWIILAGQDGLVYLPNNPKIQAEG